jgi:two-component system response regulator WspF
LAERTGRTVRVAEPGERPQADTVLLAGTNDHLVLSKHGTLEYREEPREIFFRPSVDVFFESVADHWPKAGIALLLTGMGRDGGKGMLRLRTAGWHTIAQDEATSVVWGMPKAAIELGGACQVLAIEQMPRAIVSHLTGG